MNVTAIVDMKLVTSGEYYVCPFCFQIPVRTACADEYFVHWFTPVSLAYSNLIDPQIAVIAVHIICQGWRGCLDVA